MGVRGQKPKVKPTLVDSTLAGSPDVPAAVKADKVALGEWGRILAILGNLGVLTKADGSAIGAYCLAYATWERAEADVRRDGIVFNTDLGGVKANPAVTTARDARRQMLSFLAEFGCTPVSRARLHLGAEVKDDLDEFTGRGGG
jgi:P27 family predicted phage terminase small subunit